MKQETGRLKEILHVLKEHKVTQGIDPVKLCGILEDLGPTYVKLGQIMSMRSDILPERYCKELARLRTDVKPMDFNTVWGILKKELHKEPNEIFQKINKEPIGCASIAQVHKAVLKDKKKVVLKIQRPNIKQIMEEDLTLLKKASGFLNFATGTGDLIDFRKVIDELWETSKEEMDFIKEAQHLERFYKNQEDVRYVTCPKVYKEYSNRHLLVMSYIDGIQIDHIKELDEEGYDRYEIGQKTAQNYCKQILTDGFFHADPHPGNLWISEGQIVWLDLGMAGNLSEHYRAIMKRAITAILKNDIYELKNAFLSFGKATQKIDHASLYTDLDDMVGKYMNMDFGTMDLGELMEDALDLLKKHKIAIDSDITLLARSMVTMEGTLKLCSPQVNMIKILTSYMSANMINEIDPKREVKHALRDIYGSSKKSLEIPAQISDLLNITKNGQVRINLESSQMDEVRRDMKKGMDHLILTLIVMALWFSSALLCLSDVTPRIDGMPYISVAGFITGLVIVIYLLIKMIIQKGRHRK